MFGVLSECGEDIAAGVLAEQKQARREQQVRLTELKSSTEEVESRLAEMEKKHLEEIALIQESHKKLFHEKRAEEMEAGRQEGLADMGGVKAALEKRVAQARKHKIAACEADFTFEKSGHKIFAAAVEQVLYLNPGSYIRFVGASANYGVEEGKLVDFGNDGAEVDLNQPEENLPNPLMEGPDEIFDPTSVVLSDVDE